MHHEVHMAWSKAQRTIHKTIFLHMGDSLKCLEGTLNLRAVSIWAVMYFRLHYKAESCIYAVKTLSCKLVLDLR